MLSGDALPPYSHPAPQQAGGDAAPHSAPSLQLQETARGQERGKTKAVRASNLSRHFSLTVWGQA